MANWKIQDIAPPKKHKKVVERFPSKEEPENRARQRSSRLPRWILRGVLPVFVLLLLSFGAVHLFFVKAEVTLWPETRQVKILEPIIAELGREKLDKEERIIPARTLTEEKKITRLFEASSNAIKVNKASGIIRVFNAYTTSPYTLIAKTRFISEEGKLFRTPVRITIPGSTDEGPGFIDIEVIAGESGEEYNVGPSSFSVPGLSGSAAFTVIYGESKDLMTGGSERQVSVVSEDDIEEAKKSLIEELTQKTIQDLLSRIPGHMIATKDSIVIEVTEAKSLVQAGAELDQFNVSVSLTALAYLFSRDDIDTLVDDFLLRELQDKERVAKNKTVTNFQKITVDKDTNTIALELSITATAYQYIDPTELKIKLRGKSKEEVESILATYSVFRQVNLSLWPFWISSIPRNIDKLFLDIIID